MPVVLIKDFFDAPPRYDGVLVTVSGWARTIRDMKSFGFLELNDGSSFRNIQVVLDRDKLENFDDVVRQNVGAAFTVSGLFTLTPEAKQPFEISAVSVIKEGESSPDYPLQKKRHSTEFLRTVSHLRPRTNLFSAVFRIRSVAAHAINCFFQDRGFVYVHTPIITCSDAEGAGEMFQVTTLDMTSLPLNVTSPPQNVASTPQSVNSTPLGTTLPSANVTSPPLSVTSSPSNATSPSHGNARLIDYSADFFGKKAGLTVSGQLNAEAYALAFGQVYTFGPTFRAENSNTPRHAAEFWMIEPEIAFSDLSDDMRLAEDMLKYVLNTVLDKCSAELEFLNSFVDKSLLERLRSVANAEFAVVTYTQAIDILENSKRNTARSDAKSSEKTASNDSGTAFQFPVYWGCDLQTEHERFLTEVHFKKPVFVTDYPKEIKAFYMRLNDDGKTVAAMDLLAPGIGEIIGGSQREERLNMLESRMNELGLDKESYWWYLDLRRYGGVKHAGFGLGFERLLMYLTGVSNIRDVIPFPRTTGSAEF